jgi:hypothetical protein
MGWTCVLYNLKVTSSVPSMKPIASVQEGMEVVDSFQGRPEDFELAVPAELLDAVGVNMAIITDRVLARGWLPDGFSEADGCRIFRFKEMA